MLPKWVSPQFIKVGLPMMSFMLLGTYGIQFTLKGRFVEKDRRKRGPIQQESTEEILTVAANPPHAGLNNFHFVFGWPDSATFELQKMQEDLAGKQVEFVPVPGKQHVDTNTREYLTKELEGLRESERWTGMSLKEQKLDVKKKLKALPRGS